MKKILSSPFFAFLWHGVFLALTVSMLDINTVFPMLVANLSSSKIIFASLLTVMLGTPLIFNMIFSHYLKNVPKKKKYLLIGIYLRSFSFLGLSASTYYLSLNYPTLTLISYFFLLLIFSVSAGFAGISYSDMVAKTIPLSKDRTKMYTYKQFLSSISGFLGGLFIAFLFKQNIPYPHNYAISLLIGFIGLFISTLGFWLMKEPRSQVDKETTISLKEYIQKIPKTIKNDHAFFRFILIENLSSFGIMIMPFYMLYAKEELHVDSSMIGIFLTLQIGGSILSNLVWGMVGKKRHAKGIVLFCLLLGSFTPILSIILGQYSPSLFGIVFVLIGFMISGRKIGFEPYLLDLAPEYKRVEYLGIRGSLNILMIVIPFIGALTIELLGYIATFGMVSIIMLLAGYFMYLSKDNQYITNLCDSQNNND